MENVQYDLLVFGLCVYYGLVFAVRVVCGFALICGLLRFVLFCFVHSTLTWCVL